MLNRQGLAGRGIVVGYDTRFGSEAFAAAVTEVTAANGIRTLLTDRAAPTPVVSHSIVDKGAGGGLVVTASHNPPQWNGLKFKPDYGGSASPEIVAELEREVAAVEASGRVERMALSEAKSAGLVRCFDPRPSYLDHLGTLVDLETIRESGMTVLVDSMYGAGAGYIPTLLAGGSTRVVELHGERNPAFPGMAQPEPLAHNLSELMSRSLTARRRWAWRPTATRTASALSTSRAGSLRRCRPSRCCASTSSRCWAGQAPWCARSR